MTLVQLVVTLIVIGVVMWLINAYIPMQSAIKKILNVVVVLVVLLFVLSAFGIIGSFPGIRLGR
jgi:small-conductance mechanosensitive channel